MENEENDETTEKVLVKPLQGNTLTLLDALDSHYAKHAQRLENCLLEILQGHERCIANVVQKAVETALQSASNGGVPTSCQNTSSRAPSQGDAPTFCQSTSSQAPSQPVFNDNEVPASNISLPGQPLGKGDEWADLNSSKPQILGDVTGSSTELSEDASQPKRHAPRVSVTPNMKEAQVASSEVTRMAKGDSRMLTGVEDGGRNSLMDQARRHIHSPAFDNIIGFIVLINAVVIAYQTEYMTQHPNQPMPGWLRVIDFLTTVVFIVELILRILIDRTRFFCGRNIGWNYFDFIIVLAALLEELLQNIQNATLIRVLRILRLVKVVRVLRTLRIFSDLRAMIQGIMSSLIAVVWAMMLLVMIFFVFGIFLTQLVSHELHKDEGTQLKTDVAEGLAYNFGSLGHTMYSLYKAITGGDDWSEFSDPLFEFSPIVGCLFCFYVAFTVFAVLNVVTGVFVENAIKINARDADMIIMEQVSQRKSHVENVRSVFAVADKDGGGTLSADEFAKHVENVCVQAYFRQLDLEVEGCDPYDLFDLLDFDGDGMIDIDEFIWGCGRLKGMARSLDLARVEHGLRALGKQLTSVYDVAKQSCVNANAMSQACKNAPACNTTESVSRNSKLADDGDLKKRKDQNNNEDDGDPSRGKNNVVVNQRPVSTGTGIVKGFDAIVPDSVALRQDAEKKVDGNNEDTKKKAGKKNQEVMV